MWSLIKNKDIARTVVVYLFCGLVVLVELGILWATFPVRISSVLDKWSDLTTRSQRNLVLAQALSEVSGIDQKQLDIYFKKASSALPEKKKTTDLLTGLSKLAQDNGLALQELDYAPGRISTSSGQAPNQQAQNSSGEIQVGGAVKAIGFSLVINGDLDSLSRFFAKLDKVSQLLGVSAFDFEPSQRTGNSGKIRLLVYFQPRSEKPLVWNDFSVINDQEKKILDPLPQEDVFTFLKE